MSTTKITDTTLASIGKLADLTGPWIIDVHGISDDSMQLLTQLSNLRGGTQ